MERAKVNGVELEFTTMGSGDPVLFISPVLADGFVPLLRHAALVEHYQLIHYHRRGWVGSTHATGAVTIEEHADDAAALLDHLGIRRAHIVGHSSGAAVGAELSLRHPLRMRSLALLELSLLSLPEGKAFLEGAGPVFQLYERGEHEAALSAFMEAVSGLEWPACRALLEERVPGMVAQSIADATTFFGIELPSLVEWTLERTQASRIQLPVLSVLGTATRPLWVEVAGFLRDSLPNIEQLQVEGVGHLLHLQRPDPVAEGLAAFLERNA